MTPSIRDQLRDEWKRSKLPLRVVADAVGVDRGNLHKKLHHKGAFDVDLAQGVAQFLRYTIVWAPRRGRSRRS